MEGVPAVCTGWRGGVPLGDRGGTYLFKDLFEGCLPLRPVSRLGTLVVDMFVAVRNFSGAVFQRRVAIRKRSQVMLAGAIPRRVYGVSFYYVAGGFLSFFYEGERACQEFRYK